ncbi:MAG: hypothetical protein GX943_03155 [Candidatus Pacebacteria bacterium]|nr:hypothetical protein [Candidatus Paceibacterota bacterium]
MNTASKLARALLPLIILIMTLPLTKICKNHKRLCSAIQAAELEFNQSILPVRFVYLDNNQQIQRIWNNAKIDDQQYILKFFNSLNQEIAIVDETLIKQYFLILKLTKPFEQGFIYDREHPLEKNNVSDKQFKVELRKSTFGIEEIYTYI